MNALDPRQILDQVTALPPGGKVTIMFTSPRARTAFKRRLAAYRAVVKRAAYSIDPTDPAYGESPYDGVQTQDYLDAGLVIFNRPSADQMGVISITES